MARPRTRAKNERFSVDVYSVHGHRLLAAVPWSEVRRKLDDGTARVKKLRDASGRIEGERIELTSIVSDKRDSPASITFKESMANAGWHGSEAYQNMCRGKVEAFSPTYQPFCKFPQPSV